MTAALLAVVLPIGAAAQSPLLNLSCLEALQAVGEGKLTGVFSFIPEKDASTAFADLIVHDPSLLKKFVEKDEADLKAARGLSAWDHETLARVVAILGSPIGQTVKRPSQKILDKMNALATSPTVTLEQLTQGRRAIK